MKPWEFIWNGWTRNYSARDDGYITHAFDEAICRQREKFVSLCGVTLEASGMVALGEDRWRPGCIKCCRILEKNGLLKLTRDRRGMVVKTEFPKPIVSIVEKEA